MTRVALLGARDEITEFVAASLTRRPGIECEVLTAAAARSRLRAEDRFDTAVYLGISLGERGGAPGGEVAGAAFQALAESGVSRVVVVSSAGITPPRHVHPGMIAEAAHPARGVNPSADRWAALEILARERLSALELTILRPTAVPTATGRDHASRMLAGRVATVFAGLDPSIQLLAAEDFAEAVACAVERSRGGVYNIAPDGVVPLRKALSLAGTSRLPLPRWAHRLGRRVLRPVGVAPLAEADRIRYSWTVSNRRSREELGFVPRLGSAEVAARFGDGPSDRRLPGFDDFGQDRRYTDRLHRTILGFLHDVWWRVELAGVENVPLEGPAVLTGVHRGFMPFDGSMAILGVKRATGRYPRFLIHPTLIKQPFLADFITRQGGVVATKENADRVLRSHELLGVFPEGIAGAFSYYRDAYRLRRDFGRNEFVKMALRNRAPIVPFVTVGSPEIFPVLAKIEWRWWMRFMEWPCFPIAPPFPLLPLPLPSKWHTRFLKALPVQERYPPEAAGDREIVEKISAEVRGRLQAAMTDMLSRRKRIFFGSIFDREAANGGGDGARTRR